MGEDDKLAKVLDFFKKAAEHNDISPTYAEEIESAIELLEGFEWDVDKCLAWCRCEEAQEMKLE